jgi:hypothetical protein
VVNHFAAAEIGRFIGLAEFPEDLPLDSGAV